MGSISSRDTSQFFTKNTACQGAPQLILFGGGQPDPTFVHDEHSKFVLFALEDLGPSQDTITVMFALATSGRPN